jgi:hypothetical protein
MTTPTLLSVSADAKTKKGEKIGVLTGILYLAPAEISGYNVCPKSTNGCRKACLYSAGRAGVFPMITEARIRKTKQFKENRDWFMEMLQRNIKSLVKKAEKKNMVPAIRLNGTSDIMWEKEDVIVDGINHPNLMTAFPDVTFYDYTKVIGRKIALALPNYHLTFSLAENNDKTAWKAIEEGYSVAVVMNLSKKADKPITWKGYPVIDGDLSDVRFNDPVGHIVALTAKGKARKDTSGFVRDWRINW